MDACWWSSFVEVTRTIYCVFANISIQLAFECFIVKFFTISVKLVFQIFFHEFDCKTVVKRLEVVLLFKWKISSRIPLLLTIKSLREEFPNKEFFLVRIFLYSDLQPITFLIEVNLIEKKFIFRWLLTIFRGLSNLSSLGIRNALLLLLFICL